MQAKYKKLLTINGSIIIILIALLVSINLFNSKHLDNNNNNEQSKSSGIGNDTQEKINNENSIQIPENYEDDGISIRVDDSESIKFGESISTPDDIDSDTISAEDNDSSSEVGNAITIADDEN
mgnify:CR=1 FL=1